MEIELEIGDNLKSVLEFLLERCDDDQLDGIGSTIREFLESKDVRGIKISKSESEGGTAFDVWVEKLMVDGF